MKLFDREAEQQPKLMIIPMIDIIFFLLVFFMISTMSMVEQHTFPVQLPAASAAKTDVTKNIPITVEANGDIRFDQEQIPAALLGRRIALEMKNQPEPVFVLRGDKDVPYNKIVAVLDALKQSGAHKVSIAVEQAR